MANQIPIYLKGSNLGERHRHLNSLVNNAFKDKKPFEAISILPEKTPVDRLFKIDLASKHKHLDYILENLRDDDMLNVSRALKAKWLLEDEYRHIISPTHLEDALYPQMITTAVNKMKHWIHLNLQDPVRCKEFYDYYHEKDRDYALKFLPKCTEDVILNEISKKETLEKITPHYLKVFCEKSTLVANIFYESLPKDKSLVEKYNANDKKYFNSLKHMLKTDPNKYLDIAEKYFMPHFNRLSAVSTKFIMTQQKDRFTKKPELYTSRILNIDTISQCLNSNECEELVLKLARAKYLSHNNWFNYKNIEPLIKKLPADKRASLKKKVFVTKDIGESVNDWPYDLPTTISFLRNEDDDIDIFLDKEDPPISYEGIAQPCSAGFSGQMFGNVMQCQLRSMTHTKLRTLLDALFDEYRFMTFNETLLELRKKIKAESSSQNRMYMLLVLVSKSGGKRENLDVLFQLLTEHHNEPCQIRAAVIRSLVKRACVWRMSDDIWDTLLIFGQGLGLDGSIPDADCDEGLHAVVIRSLLLNGTCESVIIDAFMKKFNKLTDYSLSFSEKQKIKIPLLNMILEKINAEPDTFVAAQTLWYAIDVIQAYNLELDANHELINTIKKLTKGDEFTSQRLLRRLYDSKMWRKELFRENFDIMQTDTSYINALKHDITILTAEKFLKAMLFGLNAEQFLRKLSVYFNESDLTKNFLTLIKETSSNKKLARPLAYLIGEELESYLLKLDTKDKEVERFSGAIKANAHVARPALTIDSSEWRQYGAKFIANRTIKCRTIDVDRIIQQLLTWKRTARLAIVLAQRTNYEADVFESVAKIRPTIALKTALKYFQRRGDQSDIRIWQTIKPLIGTAKIANNSHLQRNIRDLDSIPSTIKPEYVVEVFKVMSKINSDQCAGELYQIVILLPQIDENFIETILHDFIQNKLILDDTYNSYHFLLDRLANLYLKILGKFLLLCKTEEIQNERFEKIGQMYLDRLQLFCESPKKRNKFLLYLNDLISSFKYCEVFLNDKYVSCLPVMEKFVKWMHEVLPMEKHFIAYIPMHLNMLYYKVIRQIANQMPEMLADKNKMNTQGYKIFGEIFGKYVGKEVHVLTKKYFDSIYEWYSNGLNQYMYCFNNDRSKLVPYMIKGIIEASDGIECILAFELCKSYYKNLDDTDKEQVRKYLYQCNQIEMQFFIANEPWLFADFPIQMF